MNGPIQGLDRFTTAQNTEGTYERALGELTAGRKQSHWIWFLLPQLQGLGTSPKAQFFAISDLTEAEAYVRHPILGARLIEIATVIATSPCADIEDLMGSSIDAMKVRSSMTLFEIASPEEPVFARVLARHFENVRDPATLSLLGRT